MMEALIRTLSLVDVSGYLIIAAILACLFAGIALTSGLRARYAALARELARNHGPRPAFRSPVLIRIVARAEQALRREPAAINTQAIIQDAFHVELRGWLIAERFVRTSTGLMMSLGLVGAFYGLMLSVGKLVALVSGDIPDATAITEARQGLARAVSGMSVAFSTSLCGILAAIVMTLLGVFTNVADRRTALMAQIEAFVDNVLAPALRDRDVPTATSDPAAGSGATRATTSGPRSPI